jgi:hypothetical protein
MSSNNKPFNAFDRPQKPLVFVQVNGVLDILLMCHQLQIFQPVVSTVKVLMVDFQAAWNRAVKRFPDASVNGPMNVLSFLARRKVDVEVRPNSGLDGPRFGVPSPSVSVLDGEHRCDAGAKKRCHHLERGFFFQHLFCLIDLLGGKLSATRNAPHVAQVADLVQSFEVKHCFPIFHGKPPVVMNQKFTPNLVGLQA